MTDRQTRQGGEGVAVAGTLLFINVKVAQLSLRRQFLRLRFPGSQQEILSVRPLVRIKIEIPRKLHILVWPLQRIPREQHHSLIL